jgi:hypothetical protein
MTSTNIGLTQTQAKHLADILEALPGVYNVHVVREGTGELSWDVDYTVAEPGSVAWIAWERKRAPQVDPSSHLVGVSPLC